MTDSGKNKDQRDSDGRLELDLERRVFSLEEKFKAFRKLIVACTVIAVTALGAAFGLSRMDLSTRISSAVDEQAKNESFARYRDEIQQAAAQANATLKALQDKAEDVEGRLQKARTLADEAAGVATSVDKIAATVGETEKLRAEFERNLQERTLVGQPKATWSVSDSNDWVPGKSDSKEIEHLVYRKTFTVQKEVLGQLFVTAFVEGTLTQGISRSNYGSVRVRINMDGRPCCMDTSGTHLQGDKGFLFTSCTCALGLQPRERKLQVSAVYQGTFEEGDSKHYEVHYLGSGF